MESSQPQNHEDHIAGKGFTSMSHHNMVHKFIPMPQAMNNTRCIGSSGQGMELETIPAWDLGKVKSKKEVILEAQRDKKKVHFATPDGHLCHFKKMWSWSQHYRSIKAESCSGETL